MGARSLEPGREQRCVCTEIQIAHILIGSVRELHLVEALRFPSRKAHAAVWTACHVLVVAFAAPPCHARQVLQILQFTRRRDAEAIVATKLQRVRAVAHFTPGLGNDAHDVIVAEVQSHEIWEVAEVDAPQRARESVAWQVDLRHLEQRTIAVVADGTAHAKVVVGAWIRSGYPAFSFVPPLTGQGSEHVVERVDALAGLFSSSSGEAIVNGEVAGIVGTEECVGNALLVSTAVSSNAVQIPICDAEFRRDHVHEGPSRVPVTRVVRVEAVVEVGERLLVVVRGDQRVCEKRLHLGRAPFPRGQVLLAVAGGRIRLG
mmetsp:Transcript_10361/g.39199  ORF Transcript_10361/g.39199 Transcript_10361/m.39199 type:complete len:317 (-) Transcript_10361:1102-2052(-)